MDDKSREITERRIENLTLYHFESQNKFVYYLLAINAACIGFTINFTKDIKLTLQEIPLGIAILFWLLSFYAGLVQIQNIELSLQVNIKELKAFLLGKPSSIYIKKMRAETIRKGVKYRRHQNIFIMLGVISFIIWHVSKMLNI